MRMQSVGNMQNETNKPRFNSSNERSQDKQSRFDPSGSEAKYEEFMQTAETIRKLIPRGVSTNVLDETKETLRECDEFLKEHEEGCKPSEPAGPVAADTSETKNPDTTPESHNE